MNKKRLHKKIIVLGCLVLVFLGAVIGIRADEKAVTILFTHDMHDHFYPQKELVNGQLIERGGYGKMAYLIEEERKKDPELILVDGGDFSMGTVFQTIYSVSAPELRLMGQMGYDAITFGNHEFDFRDEGLAKMLAVAVASGDKLPEIIASNMSVVPNQLESSMKDYGVKPYTILESNGAKIGVFGLMGEEAASNAPMTEVVFLNPIEEAKKIVKVLAEEEKVDLIVCLSHSGTKKDKSKSEDEILAKEVPEIDVIVSGHTHSTLPEPIVIGNTIIGSIGENGSNIGKLVLKSQNSGKWALDTYTFIPVEGELNANQEIERKIDNFAQQVETAYLKEFGFEAGEVIAHASYSFEESQKLGKEHKEIGLANLIADSYMYAVEKAEGKDYTPVDVAIVPSGVIRGSFVEGDITVEDVFNVSSLGIGADGISGYPLVSAYLTGKELKTICEVDASIAPIMSVAQLYTSGMHYTFNPNRLIFNKITDAYLVGNKGERIEIEDDKLYRIVAGLYSAQMLSIVGDQSFGILSIIPKDKDGIPITDFEKHIIHNSTTGREVKEWVALAQYMQSFEKINGISELPESYNTIEGRKVVDSSKELWDRIKNPNKIAMVVYSIVIALGVIVVLMLKFIVGHLRKRRHKM